MHPNEIIDAATRDVASWPKWMRDLRGINRMTTTTTATEELFLKALVFAERAHKGQKRWEGDPYIVHPRRVAGAVEGYDAKIVALLHDVVEDTPYTLDQIAEEFGDEIASAVDSVTHREGETYLEFILRSKQNPLGRVVKIADINDNLRDIDKFKRQKECKEKYVLARWILENV